VGEGCVCPASGAIVPPSTTIRGPCDAYVCAYHGWVLLEINPECCTLSLASGMMVRGYYDGDVLKFNNGARVGCYAGQWLNIGTGTGGTEGTYYPSYSYGTDGYNGTYPSSWGSSESTTWHP